MTPSKRTFLFWWLGGLAAFAVAIYLHLPLIVEGVPGGIGDHQRAPDAATVEAIHDAWRRAGVFDDARIAMIADLIFIGIYGIGCVLGGIYFRAQAGRLLSGLGWIALISGVVFLATDYGETISQFMQISQQRSSDALAALASTLRPLKMASFIAAFLAIVAALVIERRSRHSA